VPSLRILLLLALVMTGARRGDAASIALDSRSEQCELRVEVALLGEPASWALMRVAGRISGQLGGQDGVQEFLPTDARFRTDPAVVEMQLGPLEVELRIAELEWSFRFARVGDGFLSEATGATATTRFFIEGIEKDLDFAMPPTLPLCLGSSCLAVVGLDQARSRLHRFGASGEPGRYALDASPAALRPISWEIAPLTLETSDGGVPLQVRLGVSIFEPRFARVPEPPGLASASALLLAALAGARSRVVTGVSRRVSFLRLRLASRCALTRFARRDARCGIWYDQT
jgi:hypothetical protein